MRKLWLLPLIVFSYALMSAQGAYAQGVRRDGLALAQKGFYMRPIPGAVVAVCVEPTGGGTCTGTASLYSDLALTVPITQPFRADANGNYTYYAAAGWYQETISGVGISDRVIPDVLLGSGGSVAATATCVIMFGADNGSVLLTADIEPQRSLCKIPFTGTVNNIIALVDAGASTVTVGYRHAGSTVALSPLLTPATVSGITDKAACANVAATAITIEGESVTCSTLAATVLTAGDWIETTGGTADGVTKRMSIAIQMVGN